METINDRLQWIVNEKFDGNKAAFAKAIGIVPTSISNYLGKQRASKPSVETAKVEQVLTHGDFSPASIHGDAVNGNMDIAVLQEKVKHLEELLAEKERLISVLMERK